MTDFEIEQARKEASRLIICTGCYGSGEDRWNEGRACATCAGLGRSVAEPHVLALITLVEELKTSLRLQKDTVG